MQTDEKGNTLSSLESDRELDSVRVICECATPAETLPPWG